MTETGSDPTSQMDGATPARPTTDDADAWKAYWQAQGMPWRTEPEITAERQAYLAERRTITPNIEQGIYPFKGVEPKLTRADVERLLVTHESMGAIGPVVWERERDKPDREQRRGLDLRGADLSGLNLAELPLARLQAGLTYEEWRGATADQRIAARSRFDRADLRKVQMEGADLREAQLAGADLLEAHLVRSILRGAHMEYVKFLAARLPGATLREAELAGANLNLLFMDAATTLIDVKLMTKEQGAARLADVRWNGVNLAVVDWTPLIASGLGNEYLARKWGSPTTSTFPNSEYGAIVEYGKSDIRSNIQSRRELRRIDARMRRSLFQEAVRSTRQLATALREQGINEEADRFAYRAQVLQRQLYLRQGKVTRALFWRILWRILDLVAGHGYKPQRSPYTYLTVIVGFASLYYLAAAGNLTFGLPASQYQNLPWYEALILSVSSFHGRGFFQPLQTLGDPVAIIASVEAVFGLFIEVAFIATFTQRFFGK